MFGKSAQFGHNVVQPFQTKAFGNIDNWTNGKSFNSIIKLFRTFIKCLFYCNIIWNAKTMHGSFAKCTEAWVEAENQEINYED